MAQMGPNTVIGFDMTGQGSIPAGFPGNPTGVEGNLLAILVLDSEYTGVGSSVDVTISDFVISGIYNGQNIGLASCDADMIHSTDVLIQVHLQLQLQTVLEFQPEVILLIHVISVY